MHSEANAWSSKIISEILPHFKISLAGSPNSCIIRISKDEFRTLVDAGAEVSLMHRRVYDSLKIKPRLQRRKACLISVSGESLQVDGCVHLTFSIGGTEMQHMSYVV